MRADYAEQSLFRPEGLLREARRQRHLPAGDVPAVCFALVTSQMAQTEGEFENGPDDGAGHALALTAAAARAWRGNHAGSPIAKSNGGTP